MLIKEIFAADITRNIAPVVYFHEQDPTKVEEEVSEYIIAFLNLVKYSNSNG